MVLNKLCGLEKNPAPPKLTELSDPVPTAEEILLKVAAYGVCHAELDEIESRTPQLHLPVVPSHQAFGRVEAVSSKTNNFSIRDRVGIAWIYPGCGTFIF